MSPDKLKVALLVTEPANLSREEESIPEETVTLLLIVLPSAMETVLEPALISVEPLPEILEARVPPVSSTEPEVTFILPRIPEALELKVPAARLIAWEIA